MADKDKVQELVGKFNEAEIQELARKLDDWAKGLVDEEKELLQLLFSRCEYQEIHQQIKLSGGTYVLKPNVNIKEAVMDALKPLMNSSLQEPRENMSSNLTEPRENMSSKSMESRENWQRGATIWPRFTWPRG
jgi:hypothetical protein